MWRIVSVCLCIAVLCASDSFARGRRWADSSTSCSGGVCTQATVEVPVTVEVGTPSLEAPPAPNPPVPSAVPSAPGCRSSSIEKASREGPRPVRGAVMCGRKAATLPIRAVKPVLRFVGKVAVKPLRMVARRR